MLRTTVNNNTFEISPSEDGFLVNGELFQWDLSRISEGYFHILHRNQSFRAEIVKTDPSGKIFQIKVNGTIYPVMLKDRFDLLLEKMGMNHSSAGRLNAIKAPMPGLIVGLKVKAGDTVKTGDPLLILEAMKMENVIKSAGDGVVKTIQVKKGDSVEKNQVLIEF